MKHGPIKRKVPKGYAGSTIRSVRQAAAKPAKPATKKTSKRRIPKVAPAPTYTHAAKKKPPAKKKPGALKRAIKFIRGDYTKKKP